MIFFFFFFFQAEDGIRDDLVTGVQTCALPISGSGVLGGKGNQADRLVGYALQSGAELFRDHLGTPHVLVGGEAIPLNSRSHNWLRGLLWEAEGRSVSGEALKTAAGTLAAFAAASGKVYELHTRSAYSGV